MAERRASAAYRIAFLYSAAFAIAVLALGVAVYFAADASFRRQQDLAIAEESAELARDYRSEGLAEILIDIGRRDGERGNDFSYGLFKRDGRRIGGTLDVPLPMPGWGHVALKGDGDAPDAARTLTTPLPSGRVLVIAVDGEAVERIDRTILGLFVLAFVAIGLIGVVGAMVLGSYLRRRLEVVVGTARAIADGDLDRRVPVGGREDEFDRLGSAINAMLDRIVRLMENLRQVSGDVAHDLRTPLARLRAELEAALDAPADATRQGQALKHALRQSDELLALFAAILRISEVEGGGVAVAFSPVDLSELVLDLCETYQPAMSDGRRTLTCDAEPGLRVSGDRELLAQAIINLLDNAQTHTPPGTAVMIDMEGGADRIRLSVADDGPGVSREDRARIVRRFVRLERSRSTPGHGLGLNLVSAIAEAHGGSLVVDDNRPGLRATIILPRSS